MHKQYFIVISLVGIIFLGVFLYFTTKAVPSQIINTPNIFYERKVISRFDKAGNSIGYVEVIRKNITAGVPRAIYRTPVETYIGGMASYMEGQQIHVTYPERLITYPNNSIPSTTVTLDLRGNVLNRVVNKDFSQTPQIFNPLNERLSSPNGQWLAETSIVCSHPGQEGPCHDDFQVTVVNTTSEKKFVITGASLSLDAPAGETVDLLSFRNDSGALYIFIHEQQDIGLAEVLNVELQSGKVTTLWTNSYQEGRPVTLLSPVTLPSPQQLHTSSGIPEIFGDHIYLVIMKYLQSSVTLVKMDIANGQLTDVLTAPYQEPTALIDPLERTVVFSDFTKNYVYDLVTKKIIDFNIPGSIVGWTHDGKYVFTDGPDKANTNTPRTGYLAVYPNGSAITIYHQSSSGNAYNLKEQKNARVGDVLYTPIGLY